MEHTIERIKELVEVIATTTTKATIINIDSISKGVWGKLQELSRLLNMADDEEKEIVVKELTVEIEGKIRSIHKTDIVAKEERIKQLEGLKVELGKIAPIGHGNKTIVLKWNGQKNALIHLFKKMKMAQDKSGKNLIPNSYEDIALFLKQSFDCFSDTKQSTILGLLKKKEDSIVSKQEHIIDLHNTE